MKIQFIAIMVIAVLFVAGCAQTQTSTTVESTTTQNQGSQDSSSGSSMKGNVVFMVTDAAADMQSVSEVHMTVDSVKVHSQTQGWVEVSSTPKTYELLELNADSRNELLAQVELEEGTYDQMQLEVSQVTVVDEQGEHEATLPSNEMIIEGELVVETKSTSSATFDVIAHESLHTTQEGEYVMGPVVEVETRSNANVDVSSQNNVKVSGGSVTTNTKVGMDLQGNVGVGLKIPANAVISISGGALSTVSGAVDAGVGVGAVLE